MEDTISWVMDTTFNVWVKKEYPLTVVLDCGHWMHDADPRTKVGHRFHCPTCSKQGNHGLRHRRRVVKILGPTVEQD